MIQAIIIEDEQTALESLLHLIKLTKEPVSVIATLETVEDTVNWLGSNPPPDLIFMDIYLKDGISFSIFDTVQVSSPIIFITAFDNFMVKAFEQNSIEYLLKPINEQDLAKAIAKYKSLQQHFINNYGNLRQYLAIKDNSAKSRILVRKGLEYQSLLLDEVVYFFTDQKLTFLITKDGKKYMVSKNLKELEEDLDPKKFYRANRKYIIHINYIKAYKACDKIKIQVDLVVPVAEDIIISQENAVDFRKWIAAL